MEPWKSPACPSTQGFQPGAVGIAHQLPSDGGERVFAAQLLISCQSIVVIHLVDIDPLLFLVAKYSSFVHPLPLPKVLHLPFLTNQKRVAERKVFLMIQPRN